MKFVDVTARLHERELLDVFQLSVGYPTPEKLAYLADTYRSDLSWTAYALVDGGAVLGVAGLEAASPGSGRIRHIAVRTDVQRSGIGRRLVEKLRECAGLNELYAESHAGALPFYYRCGFTVSSLGERYPGVERFACSWRVAEMERRS